jgi:hypothetical protein
MYCVVVSGAEQAANAAIRPQALNWRYTRPPPGAKRFAPRGENDRMEEGQDAHR